MGNKIKLPLEIGLAAIFNRIKAIRKTAEQSGSAVSTLAQMTAASVGEIEDALNEKQDAGFAISVTIPTTGWSQVEQNETAPDTEGNGEIAGGQAEIPYPYWYDIPVEGITANDRADIEFSPDCINEAVTYGICPTSESAEGKVKIRSVTIPQNALTAEIWIMEGKG